MAPKVQNKSTYKYKVRLGLERLKINAVNKIKIYLNKIIMKPLATENGTLSQDVNLFMILPKSNTCRYYALNDTTIRLLMNGQIDENAITSGVDDPKFSDVEISNLIEQEPEVIITVVKIGEENKNTSWRSLLETSKFNKL